MIVMRKTLWPAHYRALLPAIGRITPGVIGMGYLVGIVQALPAANGEVCQSLTVVMNTDVHICDAV